MKRTTQSALVLTAMILASFLGGIAGSWLFGASAARAQGEMENIVANEIIAKSLLIVDDEGVTRAEVSISDDGSAGVLLYGVEQDLRAYLGTTTDGTPNLFLYDPGKDGAVRAALGLSGDGEPSLILFDAGEGGMGRAALSMFSDGSASFSVSGANGQSGVAALASRDGGCAMIITDSAGSTLWAAP